jgi:hypothetical protein
MTHLKRFAVIGERRANNGDPIAPVWTCGQSAERLAGWFGLKIERFAELIEGANVSEPIKSLELLIKYRLVVLVGRKAAEALLSKHDQKRLAPSPSLLDIGSNTILFLPHPSGRNRKLNDIFYRQNVQNVCRFFLRKYLPDISIED